MPSTDGVYQAGATDLKAPNLVEEFLNLFSVLSPVIASLNCARQLVRADHLSEN